MADGVRTPCTGKLKERNSCNETKNQERQTSMGILAGTRAGVRYSNSKDLRNWNSSLKRCPTCGSVSPDDEIVCGVCGCSLADVGYEAMDEIDQDDIADKKRVEALEQEKFRVAKRREFRIRVVILVTGVGLMIGGLWLATVPRVEMGLALLVIGMIIVGGSIDPRPGLFLGPSMRRRSGG